MRVLKIATYSLDTRWFTAVMATIIIASVSQLYGYAVVVPYLFVASLVIFFSVSVFKATQITLFYKDVSNEMLNPEKTLYLFAVVGAINLVGISFSKVFHLHATADIFWYVAISLWLGASLYSFSVLFLHQKSEDRKIEDILHGGWFFATVGTQSTAFLGIVIAEHAVKHVMFIHLFSFALWSVGACLYLIFGALIILRLVFYKLANDTALSPYWMNAGAAALTALTGITLYQNINFIGSPLVDFLPFVKGITLFFWSVGLWWLPFLIILAIRKCVSSGEGLPFTVGYWEITFVLGLYASSTVQLVGLFEGHYLVMLSVCFYIACIILWCFSSIFTAVHLVRSSIWVPVNDLTINCIVPYSFKLRGKLFRVKKVTNEWLDQTVQGVLKKRYCIITNNNLTCTISYSVLTKKWYLDQVEN